MAAQAHARRGDGGSAVQPARIELAADPAGLAVYLRSHSDKLLASQGVSGDVVLLGAQGKPTAALTPGRRQ